MQTQTRLRKHVAASFCLVFHCLWRSYAAAASYTQQHPVSMTTSIMVAFIMACGPHQDRPANIKLTLVYSPHRKGVTHLLFEVMLVASLPASLRSKHFKKITEVKIAKEIELI